MLEGRLGLILGRARAGGQRTAPLTDETAVPSQGDRPWPRYAPSAAFASRKASTIADCLAPPFDVISPDEQRRLYQRSPYNAIRLEYGETSDADDPPSTIATLAPPPTLHAGLPSGVLLRDDIPRPLRLRPGFTHRGSPLTRRALFARVRLHDWDEGIIRPHERTLSRPKEDRLSLLRACRVNISPVLSPLPRRRRRS